MVAFLFASAINLAALQASVTAPTETFRGCLKEAAAKAKSEKIGGDAIEDYLRNACTVQMSTLKSALVSFRMKNGMSRKAAGSDAEMTVDDYVSTPADNYRFLVNMNAPKPAPAAPAATSTPGATPAPTPASATTNSPPPKP
jgi:hypothetical protein